MGKLKKIIHETLLWLTTSLGCMFPITLGIFILVSVDYFDVLYSTYIKTDKLYILVISGIISLFTIFLFIYAHFSLKFEKLEKDCENVKKIVQQEYEKKNRELEADYQKRNKELTEQKKKLDFIISSQTPFICSATLAADMSTYIYSSKEYYLKFKQHPARTAAAEVKALRHKTKDYIVQYKEMLYKYEFLLKTFPELQKYVDDEEALLSLENVNSYTELTENTDHARDYLSEEEWKKLSIDERNQLALDRYKKQPKSNWEIGIEYEMYVDFILRTKYHFSTIPFGSLKGLDDLGRDIIATRIDVSGAISTYIIQCKYWANTKVIHENVVCQTFGTAMEYQLKRNLFKEKVIPVITTTTTLSDMAQKFANKLGVLVWKIPKGEYPVIKCNIGTNGEKIYHLPFDQQYYRTEIKNPGEFYAWTVREATSKGFRRALKHILNN